MKRKIATAALAVGAALAATMLAAGPAAALTPAAPPPTTIAPATAWSQWVDGGTVTNQGALAWRDTPPPATLTGGNGRYAAPGGTATVGGAVITWAPAVDTASAPAGVDGSPDRSNPGYVFYNYFPTAVSGKGDVAVSLPVAGNPDLTSVKLTATGVSATASPTLAQGVSGATTLDKLTLTLTDPALMGASLPMPTGLALDPVTGTVTADVLAADSAIDFRWGTGQLLDSGNPLPDLESVMRGAGLSGLASALGSALDVGVGVAGTYPMAGLPEPVSGYGVDKYTPRMSEAATLVPHLPAWCALGCGDTTWVRGLEIDVAKPSGGWSSISFANTIALASETPATDGSGGCQPGIPGCGPTTPPAPKLIPKPVVHHLTPAVHHPSPPVHRPTPPPVVDAGSAAPAHAPDLPLLALGAAMLAAAGGLAWRRRRA